MAEHTIDGIRYSVRPDGGVDLEGAEGTITLAPHVLEALLMFLRWPGVGAALKAAQRANGEEK